MILKLTRAFNRSFAFSKIKLLITNIFLLLCFLLFLFFYNVNLEDLWFQTARFFTPIFLSLALFFCLGIFIQSIYEEEQGYSITDQKSFFLKRVWIKVTNKLNKSIYLTMVPIFLFLGLWILLGIMYLLQDLPVIGLIFQIFLMCLPFSLLFAIISLVIYEVVLLFYIVPEINEKKRGLVRKTLLKIKKNLFQSLVYLSVALLPFPIFWGIVDFTLALMPNITFISPVHQIISALFLSLPILFIASFLIIFFFQFSYEIHLTEKK